MVAARHSAFRLLIAGDGGNRSELAALAESLSLGNRIEFLGDVSDVPALLRRASMFVLPSLTEGLPLTVLEAMATGLPVIATRVGGTPEVVDDGTTGLLVDPREPEQMARAMMRIFECPELGRRLGDAAHLRVAEHFDVREMVSRYESLYEEVLGANRRAAARAA
jgi:glycosyltransferase involved in cell wall biosynthesis